MVATRSGISCPTATFDMIEMFEKEADLTFALRVRAGAD